MGCRDGARDVVFAGSALGRIGNDYVSREGCECTEYMRVLLSAFLRDRPHITALPTAIVQMMFDAQGSYGVPCRANLQTYLSVGGLEWLLFRSERLRVFPPVTLRSRGL